MTKQQFNLKTIAEAPMKDQVILEETQGPCRIITLRRPEAKNSLNFELAAAIPKALSRAAKDRSIKVVVIRGAGDAFSAGGDLKLFHENLKTSDKAFRKITGSLNRAIKTIATMRQLVIAAIRGPAYAAGFGLAISCDLTVASEEAKLSPSFVKIALAPNAGTTFYLPRILGAKRAMEAILTGRVFSAKEAQTLGLVSRVWPEASFESELSGFIADLCSRPTLTLARIKKLLKASAKHSLEKQLQMEKAEIAASSLSLDFKEGVQAFVKKHQPKFRGM